MTLKNVLLTNAVSSGMTGVLLATLPSVFTQLFEIGDNTPFIMVGIFLIVFSLFVFATAMKGNIPIGWTKFIITLDIIWVIASAIAIIILFSTISTIGSFMILAVAGWVGMMAYLQSKNLNRI
ncbi:hypothetical protein [Sphingobacterium prati]|jgi:hypothetical protein|uniref:hypothetical protein n=1 Tax=Sphingobacterium prati TaxID=2737006 RepID=UPI0015533597|nr:hypothetical protein [Sphingobacterium prati]MDF2475233.1 Uncharacterized protein [Sphingobacterium sp.]NPE48194.1 hypothetical protein [Sphingobacterium prati]